MKTLKKKLKEEYGYDTLLDIYTYQKLIQFKSFLFWIHYFVTVFGKWVFESNFTFHFLSLKTISTTVVLIIMKQN